MGEDTNYIKFQAAARASQKLACAADALMEDENYLETVNAWYLDYLKARKRSAVEYALECGSMGLLCRLERLGWVEERYRGEYIEHACQNENREAAALLLRMSGLDSLVPGSAPPAGDTDFDGGGLAAKIWEFVRKKIGLQKPALELACGMLHFQSKTPCGEFATDGKNFFYEEQKTLEIFRDHPESLCKVLLHTLMHCLLLHIHGAGRRDNQRLWNLACDIQADHYAEILEGTSGAAGVVKTADQICREWEDRYDCLRRQGEQKLFEQELRREEERHRKDDHSLWYLPDTDDRRRCSGSEDGTRRGDPKRWIRAACRIGGEISGGERKVGTRAGRKSVSYTLRRKKQYDFREFLRQFAVCGEAMELDQDSFDYIPYWYSLSHYDEVVFLEPLEYREVYRLAELVIAIDTSGSCSGSVVQGFLEQTYQIFREKENFFDHMNVYIIQCDSMIQSVAHITREEEWKSYMEQIHIQGFGGTDFRPVFSLVEKKIKNRELLNLRGMLYFTDGDGIYPDQKPWYETAFVYLNDAARKGRAPAWAWELNLNMEL